MSLRQASLKRCQETIQQSMKNLQHRCGWCSMSAMHWEARRRQQVLDRRLSASVKQDGKRDKKQEKPDAHVTQIEPSEEDKQCNCTCHAQMSKRYTVSVDYFILTQTLHKYSL
ncbi:hypothetical protein DNTS_032631 [Danionella cerebrum]|uniref:Uncharacterized protein n=1 Tax=Danionella cerebrum TaxID=2873325 RepID=A0A553MPM4_9TELE|nr:hypothetical protein DNTS_032631 [Danionella translucida]